MRKCTNAGGRCKKRQEEANRRGKQKRQMQEANEVANEEADIALGKEESEVVAVAYVPFPPTKIQFKLSCSMMFRSVGSRFSSAISVCLSRSILERAWCTEASASK
jgi:hypothetical protein